MKADERVSSTSIHGLELQHDPHLGKSTTAYDKSPFVEPQLKQREKDKDNFLSLHSKDYKENTPETSQRAIYTTAVVLVVENLVNDAYPRRRSNVVDSWFCWRVQNIC